jgi:hypothetical protein
MPQLEVNRSLQVVASNPDRPDYSRTSPAVITNSVSYRAYNNHPILSDQDIST